MMMICVGCIGVPTGIIDAEGLMGGVVIGTASLWPRLNVR